MNYKFKTISFKFLSRDKLAHPCLVDLRSKLKNENCLVTNALFSKIKQNKYFSKEQKYTRASIMAATNSAKNNILRDRSASTGNTIGWNFTNHEVTFFFLLRKKLIQNKAQFWPESIFSESGPCEMQWKIQNHGWHRMKNVIICSVLVWRYVKINIGSSKPLTGPKLLYPRSAKRRVLENWGEYLSLIFLSFCTMKLGSFSTLHVQILVLTGKSLYFRNVN